MAVLLLCVAGAGAGATTADADRWRWALPKGVSPPLVSPDNPMTRAKVALGRRLFYDADLSIDGTMACATCHEQKHGFADGNRTHPGVDDAPGRRNVPGLANVAWAPRLTWANPHITTLEAQVAMPLFGDHPVEMGMKGQEAELVRRLERDQCYPKLFRAAFPDDAGRIDMPNVAKALASFQRTLTAYRTPYDRFVRGDRAALPQPARRGASLFAVHCAGCHAGANFSDGQYHAIAASPGQDRGLAEISGAAADAGKFRTPNLRNVALTAPYLHDGSAATLAAAIRRHQSAQALDDTDAADLVALLGHLTDRHFITDRRFSLPDKACGNRL